LKIIKNIFFWVSFNCIVCSNINAVDNLNIEISDRLISLKYTVNLFLYLNSETKKIVNNFDSNNNYQLNEILDLYDILLSYVKVELNTEPRKEYYVKNLNSFISIYQKKIEQRASSDIIANSNENSVTKNVNTILTVKGYDDGIKTNYTKDRNEALLNAKQDALQKVIKPLYSVYNKLNSRLVPTLDFLNIFDLQIIYEGYEGERYFIVLEYKVKN